jgi:hypothetical protein
MSHITVSADKVVEHCNHVLMFYEWLQAHFEMAALKKYAKEKRFLLFGSEIGYEKALLDIESSKDPFAYMDYNSV